MTALQAMKAAFFLKSIACTFPPPATRRRRLASVLDLEQYHPSGSGRICKQMPLIPRRPHTREHQMILMLISLYDVNFVPFRRTERIPCRMIKHTECA
jgi:hypothetical protein